MSRKDKQSQALREAILNELLKHRNPKLKLSIAHRVAEKLSVAILKMRLSAWDPVHIGTMKAVTWFENLTGPVAQAVLNKICDEVFYGEVVPIQRTKIYVRQARSVYLSKCVCRFSGRTNDLYSDKENQVVYSIVENDRKDYHLERLKETYLQIKAREEQDLIDPEMRRILDATVLAKEPNSEKHYLDLLWEMTWPWWEINLVHEKFTEAWKDTMGLNHKNRQMHKELLEVWIDAIYETRGQIFSTMKVVTTPYTICCCPGPENDGGCLLFNWHYYSGNESAIRHNANDFYGQRRDVDGTVLPCKRFPERSTRDCLGCGCPHDDEN